MKARTIKQVIRKKVDQWLESITDPAVKELASKNVIVTGGCIASMLLQEPVNDFDLYFRTRAAAYAVAKYYLGIFKVKDRAGIVCPMYVEATDTRVRIVIKSAGIASEQGTTKPYQYFESQPADKAADYVAGVTGNLGTIEETYETAEEQALTDENADGKFRPIFMSTNAITLAGKVQLILRFFGEPDQLHENYDFAHCTNYWTSWDSELVLRPKALECLLARELIYVGSKYPVCSVFRLRKFIKRNFTIGAGQILKICMQIAALDLTDIETLQDQLTGVDCAYFLEVVELMKAKDPTRVDTAYLIEIIDRMF